jgi:hypothetical protein
VKTLLLILLAVTVIGCGESAAPQAKTPAPATLPAGMKLGYQPPAK